jgi:hypothetical protein
VMGRPAKAVEGLLEQPEPVFLVCWVALRWHDHGMFVVGQRCIAKYILTVALL